MSPRRCCPSEPPTRWIDHWTDARIPLRRPFTFLSPYGRKAEREGRGSQSDREFLTHHHKALRKTWSE